MFTLVVLFVRIKKVDDTNLWQRFGKNEILISFPFHFINRSLVNNGIGITCLECYAWSQKGLRVIDKLGITEHTYIVGLFEIGHQLVDIVGSWNGTT